MSYAMPQTGFLQEGFAGAPPLMTLPRRWTYRVLILLFGLPMVLGAFVLAVGSIASAAGDSSQLGGAIVIAAVASLAGAGFALLFGWLFWREMKRSAALYEQGIELKVGAKVTSIRWADVSELYIAAIRVRAGGVVGLVGGAIADAMRKDQPLKEGSAQITVRVKASDGRQIKLSNQDQGVLAAYQLSCRKINPRLVEAAVSAVKNGQTASFGTVTLSNAGVAFGKKPPTSYAEIKSLGLDSGRIVAKKEGKWLNLGSAMVASTPNVYVLLSVYNRLAAGGVPDDPGNVQVGQGIVGKTYVSG